jgi:chromate transporter
VKVCAQKRLVRAQNVKSFARGSIDYIWLHGLKLVAVAIVSQAVVGMTSTRLKDLRHITLIFFASLICINNPSQITQFIVIFLGAMYGLFFLRDMVDKTTIRIPININIELAKLSALILVCLIIIFILFINYSDNVIPKVLAEIFIVGTTVFGGGHVVLPMLHQVVVASGLMSNDVFLAGYGITQALPGPLFTFSSYLGAVLVKYPYNLIYGIFCLIAIFLPSFLMLNIIVPVWNNVQNSKKI